MKKNKLFRLLTVALTLVFLCQLAITAFAATTSWEDNGDEFTGEVIRSGSSFVLGLWEMYPSLVHTQGTVTGVNQHPINLGYSTDLGMGSYKGSLQPAWEAEGYMDAIGGMTIHTMRGIFFIPEDAPSGTYQLQAEVIFHPGVYSVYQMTQFGYFEALDGGDFSGPTIVTGNCLAYRRVSTP